MNPEPDPPTRRYDPAPPVDPAHREVRQEFREEVRQEPRQEVVQERTEDSRASRVRTIRVVTSLISFITALFAVVLAIAIVLVLAEANPENGFASFIGDFAGAVSLGFDGLFTPDSEKLAVLFNYGAAAIVWLLIGSALTYLVRRFGAPSPNRTVSYRRTVQ
ncbi:hypothetical protein ACFPM7_24330 [Actinokineospora guangxiensis]|uniref:Uncharacterized protein n=1 Tax=Actinokineospora guangxiensis TaxID=1490288 RepID=A0ABW0EWC0_9PSEU